uniref:Ig-like domain-containing protein n=1 Tax=Hippocampus comes TaxID=109280 RepID=A0A3Q2Y5B6_HIPCM
MRQVFCTRQNANVWESTSSNAKINSDLTSGVSLLLLCLLRALKVSGHVGHNVTMPCAYSAQAHGLLMCWGRGSLPSRGCANEVIKTDGTSVTSRSSERYLLMGNIVEGDVSLTIRQVVESDSGVYGCRVEIPGWFNDRKHQMSLMVVPGESQIAVDCTVNLILSGLRPSTQYSVLIKAKTNAGLGPASGNLFYHKCALLCKTRTHGYISLFYAIIHDFIQVHLDKLESHRKLYFSKKVKVK